MPVHARRTHAQPVAFEEPTTGVRRKTLPLEGDADAIDAPNAIEAPGAIDAANPTQHRPARVVSASSSHPTLMFAAFAAGVGALALPTTPTRILGAAALVAIVVGHEVVTCRRVDVTNEGVRIVVDEELEELVPWSDVRGLTRRRLGPLEMLTLDRPRRPLRIRLLAADHEVVDRVEKAIRAAIA